VPTLPRGNDKIRPYLRESIVEALPAQCYRSLDVNDQNPRYSNPSSEVLANGP